ncbi:hypothetical protein [Thermogemmatispora tikiterensis]|uniref:Uncharacterized protein n=1 Tax=Thermogemmatispora tikiterensis TaxID=1825093 RepID=A0A328VID2_9CHLR|nr:hypothetical protein [Thermogemmatispora tikiterensis]RAQ96651.1 hypothetical protein A4R35_13995 [Thermogemmatispora tikiterensis]
MENVSKKSTAPGVGAIRPLLSLALLLTLLMAMLALTACAGHALRSQNQTAPASSQSQSLPASTSNQSSTPSAGSGSPAQQVQSVDQQVQSTLPSLDQAQNDANSSDQGQDNAPLP